MFPQSMSRLALRPDESPTDPSHILEKHIRAGFPPDLALDLVLNELVVRAAEVTRASAAALALVRGNENEMVCRAATGPLAPGLGIPLSPRDGLSGACLESRQPQICVDTERDPRVDSDISRRLGIRSILAVPVFDISNNAKFTGVLEVFSTSVAAFSNADQKLLEGFGEECARVRHDALKLSQRKPVAVSSSVRILPALTSPDSASDLSSSDFTPASPLPARPPYQIWSLLLGILTIVAAIALGFLIGARVGWLRATASRSEAKLIPAQTSVLQASDSCAGRVGPGCPVEQSSAVTNAADHPPNPSSSGEASGSAPKKPREKASRKSSPNPTDAVGNDLVVYQQGKVIFRLKPTPTKTEIANNTSTNDTIAKTVTAKNVSAPSVMLTPHQADELLQSRTEPAYPPSALGAHSAGDVVLEVQVAEDGSVSHVRLLRGDPVLAAAAAEAVRTWRYQPYRVDGRPSPFQTDITLTFTLPN